MEGIKTKVALSTIGVQITIEKATKTEGDILG